MQFQELSLKTLKCFSPLFQIRINFSDFCLVLTKQPPLGFEVCIATLQVQQKWRFLFLIAQTCVWGLGESGDFFFRQLKQTRVRGLGVWCSHEAATWECHVPCWNAWLEARVLCFPCNILLMCCSGGSRCCLSLWEGWMEFWAPGVGLAVAGMYGVNQQMEDLCLFFYVCFK